MEEASLGRVGPAIDSTAAATRISQRRRVAAAPRRRRGSLRGGERRRYAAAAETASQNQPLLSGWLSKGKRQGARRFGLGGGVQLTKRYFDVKSFADTPGKGPRTLCLAYYRSDRATERRGWLLLREATRIMGVTPTCFVVEHPKRSRGRRAGLCLRRVAAAPRAWPIREGGSRHRRGSRRGYSAGTAPPARPRRAYAAETRRRRRRDVNIPRRRVTAAALDLDIPWRRVAATPWPGRGYSVETGPPTNRGAAEAATRRRRGRGYAAKTRRGRGRDVAIPTRRRGGERRGPSAGAETAAPTGSFSTPRTRRTSSAGSTASRRS